MANFECTSPTNSSSCEVEATEFQISNQLLAKPLETLCEMKSFSFSFKVVDGLLTLIKGKDDGVRVKILPDPI